MSSNQSHLQEQYFIAWLANDARPLKDTHFGSNALVLCAAVCPSL